MSATFLRPRKQCRAATASTAWELLRVRAIQHAWAGAVQQRTARRKERARWQRCLRQQQPASSVQALTSRAAFVRFFVGADIAKTV